MFSRQKVVRREPSALPLEKVTSELPTFSEPSGTLNWN